jgi:hypothetical protein
MTSRSQVITTFVHREMDPSKHSAAYKIFHYEWDVLVPHMYVYTEEYIRIAGTVSSTPDYDARLPKQMIGGRYTIAQIAQLMDEGATIQLTQPIDAKTIYDIVSSHLEDWSSHLIRASAFDLSKVPVQDLMLLSQMADVLYGYAARHFTKEAPRGKLARKLDQIRGRYKLGSGRKYVDPNQPIPEEERTKMPDHNQSSQSILQHGGGRNAWS